MRILLKKNQLALILLTLVMMLTVYYIKSPFDKDKDPGNDDPQEETSGRLEQLSLKRVALKESRKELIMELDAVIASEEATVAEKNAALTQKQRINALNEKELLLELEIINKGFRDAFVHATDEYVDVTVVADEHSASLANELVLATLMQFEGLVGKARVTFQTVQQVMGEVSN
jgi:hypothetical protein